ncbi:MAG: N-acetylmuramic acid 6-phosphate etherase [Bryobacteraceae bacterium]|nr:N-acetylmuramic acid 6-phosphate etherase [Bryobacteraceae bacterium]
MSDLDKLLTEQANPASEGIDRKSTVEMLEIINAADAEIAAAVRAEIPAIARAVDAVADAMRRGGRLFYIGAGTSGRLGVLDASECPPTFNVPPSLVQGIIAGGEPALSRAVEASEDDPELGAADLIARGFERSDVLVGIAASGRTPYVLGAIARARAMGALTIGVSCTARSALSRAVEIAIEPKPGAEVIAGSTRMRAGTATKLVLNMLSTGVMIRLGHVFGNRMVNVQPSNEKLADRARRIIMDAAGVDYSRASELLEASGRNVKTAVLMHKLGLNRQAAAEKLEAVQGRIHDALEIEN